jgi:PAS domain S-box-containing protein
MAERAVKAARPDAELAQLRDRAIRATHAAFTLTDADAEDGPLIWVNPAFCRMTGYTADEVIGRNCRFLQGPATDPAVVAQLRTEIAARRPVTVTMLNYRKDGSTFWNQLTVSPVRDRDDRLISFVGVQTDVTERVRAQQERERALTAERMARQDAEEARRRLAILSDATAQLAATLDVGETLQRLTHLVVPSLADWVVINLVDAHGAVEKIIGRHRSGREHLLRRYAELARHSVTEGSWTRRILDGGDPVLVADAAVAGWRDLVTSDELVAVIEELGVGSLMYVPLVARRRRILGSITFVSGTSGRYFDAEDLAVAADLGRRAGLTFDNARLYEREHRVAEALQRSLLPALPHVDGLEVAVRYLPGDADADVGGDFYDLLPLPDGTIGFAAGDVVGHDLSAAAAMGHLRGLLRACAWNSTEDGPSDPVEVLSQVDSLVQGLDVVPLATLLYGRLDRPRQTGDAWRFTYANAGHPAPLLRLPDGTVEILDAVHGILLGVTEPTARERTTVEVPAGATLVAFTDGLVERRDDSIDHGVARLIDVLEAPDPGPTALVERLVATLGAERSDDTAVIAVRVPAVGAPGATRESPR